MAEYQQLKQQYDVLYTEYTRSTETARVAINEKEKHIMELDQQLQEQQAQIAKLKNELQAATLRVQSNMQSNTQPTGTTHIVTSTCIGSIEPYERKTDWTQWLQRLELFMSGNMIIESRRTELFLNLLGSEGYALLSSLCAPKLPKEKTYEEIITVMSNHLKPKPSVITERFKFNICEQKENQSIREYLATLKMLSTYCEYGENLNDVIRDRFVRGLRNKRTKRKLLSESKLTYDRAIDIAVSNETAAKDTGEMDLPKQSDPVNYVKSQRFNNKRQTEEARMCTCCGGKGHLKFQCKYKEYECDKCKRKGHLIRVCRFAQNNNYNNENYKYKQNENKSNDIRNKKPTAKYESMSVNAKAKNVN